MKFLRSLSSNEFNSVHTQILSFIQKTLQNKTATDQGTSNVKTNTIRMRQLSQRSPPCFEVTVNGIHIYLVKASRLHRQEQSII